MSIATTEGGAPKKRATAAAAASPEEEVARFFKTKTEYEKNVKRAAAASAKKRAAAATTATGKPAAVAAPKCIHCGRAVGMIFKVARGEYSAVCGDKSRPCDFKIFIQKPTHYLYRDFLRDAKKDLETVKMDIITSKLDLLFGYKSEAETLEFVKRRLAEYSDENLLYQNTVQEYKNIVMSPERAEEIKKLQTEIEDDIHKIQTIMKMPEPNMEEITEIYRDRLQPNVERLRTRKYDLVETKQIADARRGEYTTQLYYYEVAPEKQYVRGL